MRKSITVIIVGFAASCFFASGAAAEDLLGHQYFEVSGGWERLKNSSSDDGVGVGVEWNMPIMVPQLISDFGMDIVLRGDIADVFDRTVREAEGLVRGYMWQEGGFIPFGGVGFGWVDFDKPDTGYLPLEGGVEFTLGPVALRPFARYSFAFDDAIGDFWTFGAKGVLWFAPDTWGLTALAEYTDYDDQDSPGAFDNRLSLRIGLIFDY